MTLDQDFERRLISGGSKCFQKPAIRQAVLVARQQRPPQMPDYPSPRLHRTSGHGRFPEGKLIAVYSYCIAGGVRVDVFFGLTEPGIWQEMTWS
jgi:hypothetical protein